VQGDKAPPEIIAGIRYFNSLKVNRPEVIIIARGGGSFEDLIAFNDENLVREVFKSDIPIISAVGHETDYTLIDLVADVRAPTPTASAEFITPVLNELKYNLVNIFKNINIHKENYFNYKLQEFNNIYKNIISPQKYIENQEIKFNNNIDKIHYLTKQQINNIKLRLENIVNNLVSPQKYLTENHQKILTNYEKINYLTVKNLENISAKFSKISLEKSIFEEKFANFEQKIKHNSQIISKNVENKIKNHTITLEGLITALKACNYQQTLDRGFAVIKNSEHKVINDIEELKNHQQFIIKMRDGEIFSYTKNSHQKISNKQTNLFDLTE
jgi:exodeoxyribonuclease VII large subunit